MDFLATPEAASLGLTGLFLASFLAATLLPGGSEAVLFALLQVHPEQAGSALLLATLGNTLGGMTTYAMGRMIPQKVPHLVRPTREASPTEAARLRGRVVGSHDTAKFTGSHIGQLERWGPPALLLAWAPVIGDALCAAAGWLRLPWLPCALWMALGKAARYGFVAWGALAI